MISANGGLPAHRYTPQVTPRWPRGSEPASMTINKSQGHTFSRVGLLLATRPFSHGQVYVALSRCGNSSAIKVWTATDLQVDANNYGVIENMVWPKILD